MALTPKQNRFAAEYLKDCNSTQAAIRCGYSPKTAEAQGSRLFRNAHVRQAIDEGLKRRAERVEVKQDDVLRELLRLAMVDIGEAFKEDGGLKPLHEMKPEVRRAIAGIDIHYLPGMEDQGPALVKKIKFWDKKGALDSLMRHLGAFNDKSTVNVNVTLEQLLLEAEGKKP